MAKQERWQSKPWQSDEEFELLLQQSLSAIQPPADFSNRVMAAIRQERAEAKTAEIIPLPQVQTAAKAKVQANKRRFGLSFWPGLGTIAASLLLFVWAGVALPDAEAGTPDSMLQQASHVQVAEIDSLPKISQVISPKSVEVNEPSNEPLAGEVTEPVNAVQPEQTPELTQPEEILANNELEFGNSEPAIEEPGIYESGAGELILPRAAFGTEASGTLSVRLLAEVENSQIYTPTINRRGSVASFYTADEENVYSWRVNLSTADSPEISVITSRSSIDDIGSILSKTTEPCKATTLVTSPDGTIIAQNGSDGVWIALDEGEIYSLSDESGGSLLAWSPDSSKLLFTNSQGQLFIGYPLEKRIYQVTDMFVEDVCWSTDNQTIIYLAKKGSQNALYIAELI